MKGLLSATMVPGRHSLWTCRDRHR